MRDLCDTALGLTTQSKLTVQAPAMSAKSAILRPRRVSVTGAKDGGRGSILAYWRQRTSAGQGWPSVDFLNLSVKAERVKNDLRIMVEKLLDRINDTK